VQKQTGTGISWKESRSHKVHGEKLMNPNLALPALKCCNAGNAKLKHFQFQEKKRNTEMEAGRIHEGPSSHDFYIVFCT
jgi:hypothetical protein